MIKLQQLLDDGYEFFTGVPDSGLKPFINEIICIGDWFFLNFIKLSFFLFKLVFFESTIKNTP